VDAQNSFRIFRSGQRGWCCLRDDRLVCGFFVSRESAVRFARRESRGKAQIRFTVRHRDLPARAA
jgi:hypothetical protein